jgi:membrane protease YdiL (CAAX protease family)
MPNILDNKFGARDDIMIENSQNTINSKALFKSNYYLASIGILVAGAGLIITRILYGLGVFDGLPEALFDFLGSFIIQIIFISGGGLVALLVQQRLNSRKLLDIENRPSLKKRFQDMGFRLPRIYLIPLSFVLGILFMIMTAGVSFINSFILLLFGYNFPPSAPEAVGGVGLFLLALFNSAVLPGVCEEFLNRGLILRGLRDTMRDKYAIIISALLFGLMHANIRQTLYTFAGGIVLAILAIKTRSILPAMIIHFTNNAVAVYLEHAYYNGWIGGNLESFLESNFLLAAALWVVFTALFLAAIYFIVKAEDKHYQKKEQNTQQENGPILLPYQTPFGVFFVRSAPLYRPKLEDKVIMYTSVFLLALTTMLTFYMGLF